MLLLTLIVARFESEDNTNKKEGKLLSSVFSFVSALETNNQFFVLWNNWI